VDVAGSGNRRMEGALVAYHTLSTDNRSGLHPNFRGLDGYPDGQSYEGLHGYPDGHSYQGLHGFADASSVGPTTFSIGPGGQWSVASASNATPTSIWDEIMNWMGESTVLAGVPNSLIALAGGLALLSFRKGHR